MAKTYIDIELVLHVDRIREQNPNLTVKAIKLSCYPNRLCGDGETEFHLTAVDLDTDKEAYKRALYLMSHIKYDDGYGDQELFGTIWYTDGSWSERYEYDGNEGWTYKAMPPIPTSNHYNFKAPLKPLEDGTD